MAKNRKYSKKASRRSSRDGPLSHLQQEWEGREAWTGGGGGWKPPPANGYEGRITDCIIAESQAGNKQLDWTIMIASPDDFEGKDFHDYQQLQTKDNLNFVEGRFDVLDIKTSDDINELGESCEAAVGLCIKFDVYKSEEFTNITITDLLEDGGGGDSKGKKPAADDYTKADIKKMNEDELTELADEQGLDPDDYDTWPLLAKALIEELGL